MKLQKMKEEEERLIREENERIEAEKKKLADLKEEKRRKKEEKVAKQKAEGTYKTKKQKEQESRAKAALDAMIAAGMYVPTPNEAKGEAKATNNKKNKNVKKKNKKVEPKDKKVGSEIKEREEKAEKAELGGEEIEPEKVESDDGVEDWDEVDMSQIVASLKINIQSETSGEDLQESIAREEKEKLRLQGLRLKKMEAERKALEEMRKAEEEAQQRMIAEAEMRKENCKKNRLAREKAARKSRSPSSLRSPVVCIMGHVDTGKTKLLDKIRQTNVQEGEAGGITQQIGATFFPHEILKEKISALAKEAKMEVKIPGMLVIDTPGHESFSNLRSRGSSLCDIAILVIDLMHGLEPQTIESINLLKSKRTPFVVALNKIDRCYAWKPNPNSASISSLRSQDTSTREEFENRAARTKLELNEKGLNAELYWKNKDLASTVSLVPTSAITGEGIPDLLFWLTKLTQGRLTEQIMFMPDLLECTVLEVKNIDGLGTTIDTIIVNGKLKENDRMVVCTMDGPVVTNIRALLTPPPSRELRIKSNYIHHKEIYGAMGVKICAQNIEKAIAGTPIMVIGKDDDEEDIKEEVMRDFTNIMKMELDKTGVSVQASTLGALEALIHFLRKECDPPIPVVSVNIGTVYRKDAMKASIMLEKGKPEYASILAFDVKIDPEARAFAEENGVRIFTADIIYHLFDQFTGFISGLMEERRATAQSTAVFPCICKILPQNIFNKKDPIIVGMEVIEGTLRVGTPLCIPHLDGLQIGRVASIEDNHRQVLKLPKGGTGAVRIEDSRGGGTLTYGRQFDASSGSLYSMITRASINSLKENFKAELKNDDLRLLVQLKKVFGIP